jgi:hypothetical protein
MPAVLNNSMCLYMMFHTLLCRIALSVHYRNSVGLFFVAISAFFLTFTSSTAPVPERGLISLILSVHLSLVVFFARDLSTSLQLCLCGTHPSFPMLASTSDHVYLLLGQLLCHFKAFIKDDFSLKDLCRLRDFANYPVDRPFLRIYSVLSLILNLSALFDVAEFASVLPFPRFIHISLTIFVDSVSCLSFIIIIRHNFLIPFVCSGPARTLFTELLSFYVPVSVFCPTGHIQ